jgi:hypothetical protein
MDQPRKVKVDVTKRELKRLERYGAIEFKSVPAPDMRLKVYIPSRTQH